MDGSSSWPAIAVESNAALGQPAGNGLGPDTSRNALTAYGFALATARTASDTTATATLREPPAFIATADQLPFSSGQVIVCVPEPEDRTRQKSWRAGGAGLAEPAMA